MLAKFAKTAFVFFATLFVCAVSASAQGAEAAKAVDFGFAHLAAGIAAGLATIGGAYGIGKLATAAMEGTARQPEAGGAIRVSMIIAAALIEGFTFFAIIVAMQLAGK
ncbi:MAG: ATP synthase F0 subunit C [Planctomycetes bacterium]|nr:ATP synthase F0 subunit C [Planctomycetota bacterium]